VIPVTVRDSTDDDVARCAEIYGFHVATSTASFELDPPSPDELARRRAATLSLGLPWIVAERDGRVVGFAYAGPWRLRPAYDWAVEDTVYVDHEAVGQGIGRALLGELVERCTDLGKRQMLGVIGGSAIEASVALHEGLGFHRVGRLEAVGWKLDTWLDVVLVQRSIGCGDSTPPHLPASPV
jgi:L-amino acid N-acyltransferase YncA